MTEQYQSWLQDCMTVPGHSLQLMTLQDRIDGICVSKCETVIQLLTCKVALISSDQMDTCPLLCRWIPSHTYCGTGNTWLFDDESPNHIKCKKQKWKSRLPPAPAPEVIIVSRTVQLNVYRPCSLDIIIVATMSSMSLNALNYYPIMLFH